MPSLSRAVSGNARIPLRGYYYPSLSGNTPNSNGTGYQVFLNGIPITDATGTTILDDIDYSTLGKVEIIKGPASSQYGTFIGGAVNLTTAQPTPNQSSLTQTVMGGNYNLLRTNTTFQHSSADGSDFVLNYGHQGYNGWRLNDFSGKEYLRASGDFKAADNQTISAYVTYNRSNEGLAGEIDSTNFYAKVPQSDANYLFNNSHIGISSFYAGVSDTYRINDRFSNQTSVFGSARTDQQVIAHGYTDVGQFNLGFRSVFNYSGQWGSVGVSGALGGQMLKTNATSNGVSIVNAPPYTEKPSDTENYSSASYLFTEWDFTFHRIAGGHGRHVSYSSTWFATRNLLVNGMVFDTTALHTKSFANTATPRFALSKTFDNNFTLYAGMSTGITPPSLSNIISNTGVVDLGLAPERAIQYELGFQGNFFDRSLNTQVRLFDLDNTNKLVSETIGTLTQTINAGEQRNEGAELSLSWNAVNDKSAALSLLRPWFSYTYTDAKYVSFYSQQPTTLAGTVNFSGNYVPRVPKTMYSVGLDAASGGWYFNTTYQYVDRVPVTYDNSTWMHSYNLLGAKIGYKTSFSKYLMNIYLGGDNLTSSTYYTFLFIGPNYKGLAQAQDSGTGDGYILPAPYGPTFYLGMSLSYLFGK